MNLFAFEQYDYLMIVHYNSDFWEIVKLSTASSATVIKACKKQFAGHGIPATVITDNGPQFSNGEFSSFAREWGFHKPAKSPYNQQSNGKAESAVKIARNIMRKTSRDKKDKH